MKAESEKSLFVKQIMDDIEKERLALGFREFEVFPTLWDECNPCQIYVMAL